MRLPKDKLLKRIAYTTVGCAIIGIGIGWLRLADLGTDPFNSMILGFADLFGISFWYAAMGTLAVLTVVVFILDRKYVGLGTLIHLVLVGFASDLSLAAIETLALPETFGASLIELAIGVVILCLGVGLYINGELGIASYDALGPIIEEKTQGKLKFRWARVMTDALSLVAGFLLGSTIGIGTVVTVFFMGPLIDFFKRRFII